MVFDGSRPKGSGAVKYSFHIVAPNVVFASNYGMMKSVIQAFVDKNKDDPLFFCGLDGKGKPKLIIDTGVYTKNRCFRTPLSHKKDDITQTKLEHIVKIETTDASSGQICTVWKEKPITSSAELLDGFVTHITKELDILPDQQTHQSAAAPTRKRQSTAAPTRKRQSTASSMRKRQSTAEQALSVSPGRTVTMSRVETAAVQSMQQFLVEKGINDIAVTGLKNWDCVNGVAIYACRNIGTRQCKVNPNEEHTRNNAFIRHKPDGSVFYHCLARSCRGKAHSRSNKDRKSFLIGKLQLFDELARFVVSELALMGPAETLDDAQTVLQTALRAMGGWVDDSGVSDLRQALTEWLNRSSMLTPEEKKKLLDELQVMVGSFGCESALLELWGMRQQRCAIGFKGGADIVYDPYARSSAQSFLHNVDTQRTDMRSLVLCMRLIWPESHDIVHEYMRFNACSKMQGVDFADSREFDCVWNIPHEFATNVFTSSIQRHFKTSVLSHSFIREVIPRLVGHAVFDYVKGEHDFRFTLDDGIARSSKLEYRLDYHTGEIKAEGLGVLHQLYNLKRFFVEHGSTKLMAEMLASVGVGEKMLFDAAEKVWRIFDSRNGIWRHRLSDYEPHSIVGLFVEQQLDPLIQLELFRGEPLPWCAARRGAAVGDTEDADSSCGDGVVGEDDGTKDDIDCSNEDGNSGGDDDDDDDDEKDSRWLEQEGKKRACEEDGSVVDSRKRRKHVCGNNAASFEVVNAKYRFGQTLKDQVRV